MLAEHRAMVGETVRRIVKGHPVGGPFLLATMHLHGLSASMDVEVFHWISKSQPIIAVRKIRDASNIDGSEIPARLEHRDLTETCDGELTAI